MTRNWYVEITWKQDVPTDLGLAGPLKGEWKETDKSCRVISGFMLQALDWILQEAEKQSALGKVVHSFRAIPFEDSPVRNIEGLLPARPSAGCRLHHWALEDKQLRAWLKDHTEVNL